MDIETKKQHYKKALEIIDVKLKGKNNLYTSHNGHMYSFIGKDGVFAVRLSKEDKQAYEQKHNTGDVIQYGATMRGYAPVVDSIASDPKELSQLIENGLKFVCTLPPK